MPVYIFIIYILVYKGTFVQVFLHTKTYNGVKINNLSVFPSISV